MSFICLLEEFRKDLSDLDVFVIMMLQTIKQALQRLTHQPSVSIVIGYKRKRSVFDFTNYEEEWLPRQNLYHKNRKPQLPGWTDPNTLYPRLIPPIRKMSGRARNYVRTL